VRYLTSLEDGIMGRIEAPPLKRCRGGMARRLGALAAVRGEDPYALIVHLLVEDRGRSLRAALA